MISHFMRRARRGVALRLRTMSSAQTPTAQSSLSTAHTCTRSALSSTCQAAAAIARFFFAPLSRWCRCGRHAHVAGCGTGSRHGLCPGRTHTSVRTSGAGVRWPSLITAWAIASAGGPLGDEGGGARYLSGHGSRRMSSLSVTSAIV